MKKCLLFLVFIAFSNVACCQVRDRGLLKFRAPNSKPLYKDGTSAGTHLIKAQKQFFIGSAFMLAGASVPLIFNADEASWYVGGALVATGIGFHISKWIHIRKAGEILNNQKIGVYLQPTGVGLKYVF